MEIVVCSVGGAWISRCLLPRWYFSGVEWVCIWVSLSFLFPPQEKFLEMFCEESYKCAAHDHKNYVSYNHLCNISPLQLLFWMRFNLSNIFWYRFEMGRKLRLVLMLKFWCLMSSLLVEGLQYWDLTLDFRMCDSTMGWDWDKIFICHVPHVVLTVQIKGINYKLGEVGGTPNRL